MDDSDYKALLIAGNLARYKWGSFIIQADEWKSFLVGHHLFMDLPSDQRAFQFDRKWIALDDKRRAFYVIRIGRGGDLSPVKFESQLKMDRLPPRINSLRLQQQKFWRDTELAIAHVHVDMLLTARRTAFLRLHRQNHWHHRWAYPMLMQQQKL